MKVALINPPPEDVNYFMERSYAPLGLLYVGTMIKDFHEVRILDFSQASEKAQDCTDLYAELARFEPQLIGISATLDILLDSTREVARRCRACCPQALIVLGGITATFQCDEVLQDPAVDVVVLREGEQTFSELLQALSAGASLASVPGLAFRLDGKVVRTGYRPLVKDLDSLPFPDHGLMGGPYGAVTSVYASRGCGLGCPYCASTSYWGRWRARSAENVVAEIAALAARWHVNRIQFVDENFCFDPLRVERICELLRERRLDVRWGCSARPEMITETLVKSMRKAGCEGIFMGIESGSDRVLPTIRRKYTAAQAKKAVDICMDSGIVPTVSFILGLPEETEEDIQRTFELMREIRTFNVEMSMLFPLYGTAIARSPERYGLRVVDSPKNECLMRARVQTRHLGPQQLEKYYFQGLGIIKKKGRKGREFLRLAWEERRNEC